MPDNTTKAVDSMGKVTEELVTLITETNSGPRDRRLVRPEQAYGDIVDQLHLPETTVLRYQDSFFALRHRLEPFLECVDEDGEWHAQVDIPPRLLLYVPLDRAKTQHALVEAEAAEVVMEPGAAHGSAIHGSKS